MYLFSFENLMSSNYQMPDPHRDNGLLIALRKLKIKTLILKGPRNLLGGFYGDSPLYFNCTYCIIFYTVPLVVDSNVYIDKLEPYYSSHRHHCCQMIYSKCVVSLGMWS